MDKLRIDHRVHLGLGTNLLLGAVAVALFCDASERMMEKEEKRKLRKVGEGMNELGKICKEFMEKESKKGEEEES